MQFTQCVWAKAMELCLFLSSTFHSFQTCYYLCPCPFHCCVPFKGRPGHVFPQTEPRKYATHMQTTFINVSHFTLQIKTFIQSLYCNFLKIKIPLGRTVFYSFCGLETSNSFARVKHHFKEENPLL